MYTNLGTLTQVYTWQRCWSVQGTGPAGLGPTSCQRHEHSGEAAVDACVADTFQSYSHEITRRADIRSNKSLRARTSAYTPA
jgi:hypothetical protein